MPALLRPVAPLLVAVLLAAAALTAAAGPARAQEPQTPLSDLTRLAELIGGAHYLRITCSGRGDQSWRTMMVRMLDLEAPEEGRRRTALVDAFNAGYTSQERRNPVCNASVREAESRLAAEGRRLAQSLSDRYLD